MWCISTLLLRQELIVSSSFPKASCRVLYTWVKRWIFVWLNETESRTREAAFLKETGSFLPILICPSSWKISCQFPWCAKPFGKEEMNRNKLCVLHPREEAPASRHDTPIKYAVLTPTACIKHSWLLHRHVHTGLEAKRHPHPKVPGCIKKTLTWIWHGSRRRK